MANYVLWKKLTPTDFNSMQGLASPGGTGGGARHIALGVASRGFPIDRFLGTGSASRIVEADSGSFGEGELRFTSIPSRRGGEWMIADQRTHRHPAWQEKAGFPAHYDESDPPVILVFRVDDRFHARVTTENKFAEFFTAPKGIAVIEDGLLARFKVPATVLISSFEDFLRGKTDDPFDPKSIEDGRKKIFAAIVQRQGQRRFREELMIAYRGRCAITRTRTAQVLEAAHIVPYRGTRTNVPKNGLLLRADVHTLFDLGLISVEPDQRQIRVSSLIRRSFYGGLHERPLLRAKASSLEPSQEALAYHYERFRK
jgi:HNH endonuclease